MMKKLLLLLIVVPLCVQGRSFKVRNATVSYSQEEPKQVLRAINDLRIDIERVTGAGKDGVRNEGGQIVVGTYGSKTIEKLIAKGLLNACKAIRHAHLDISTTSTKLSGEITHAVTHGSNGVMKLCVTETIIDIVINAVLSIHEPREINAKTAAKAASETIPPTVTADQKKQEDPRPVTAETHAATITTHHRIAAVASRAYKHRCSDSAVFISKSHISSFLPLTFCGQ